MASADRTDLAPGESAAVELRLLYEQVDYSILKAGTRFDILEGGTIVGSGTVLTT